jgi:hypothetical protein
LAPVNDTGLAVGFRSQINVLSEEVSRTVPKTAPPFEALMY